MIFFFKSTTTTETYTLSLHDALPIYVGARAGLCGVERAGVAGDKEGQVAAQLLGLDRKSTRLNSSHRCISYAVFCLKKKKRRTPCTEIPTTHTCLVWQAQHMGAYSVD